MPPPGPPQSDRGRAVWQPCARGPVCGRVASGRLVRDSPSDDASLDGLGVLRRARCTRRLVFCDAGLFISYSFLTKGVSSWSPCLSRGLRSPKHLKRPFTPGSGGPGHPPGEVVGGFQELAESRAPSGVRGAA